MVFDFFKRLFGIGQPEPTPEIIEDQVQAEPALAIPEGPEKPAEEPKLLCTLSNEGSKSTEVIKALKVKTKRRALRHFAGKEVRHRVTEKKADTIEFAYFRRSGNPVRIRWQKIGARTEQTA